MYDPRLVDVVNYISLGERGEVMYHYVIIDYLVASQGGEPHASSDAEDLKWVPFNEVEEYDLTENLKFLLAK